MVHTFNSATFNLYASAFFDSVDSSINFYENDNIKLGDAVKADTLQLSQPTFMYEGYVCSE
jgi:hypothetical protein